MYVLYIYVYIYVCIYVTYNIYIYYVIHTYMHYIALHYIALHYISLHYVTLNFINTQLHTCLCVFQPAPRFPASAPKRKAHTAQWPSTAAATTQLLRTRVQLGVIDGYDYGIPMIVNLNY